MKQILKGLIIIIILILLLQAIPSNISVEISEINPVQEEIVSRSGFSRENIEEKVEDVVEENIITEEENVIVEEIITQNFEIGLETNLRTMSNISADVYDKMLEGTNLYGLGGALEQAEKESQVNGLYLMGLACLESSYGTSRYARERNNLVGWGAYDSNPNKAKYFSSKDECILYVANRLSENYLSENGCYFNGYTAPDIDKKYCTDKKHANKIIQIINKLKKGVM